MDALMYVKTARAVSFLLASGMAMTISVWAAYADSSDDTEAKTGRPGQTVASDKKPGPRNMLKRRLSTGIKGEIRHLENGGLQLGKIKIMPGKRAITFPAEINQINGPIEVLIATMEGRLHESLLRTSIRPLHFQLALYLLGFDNGTRLGGDNGEQGDLVNLNLVWTGPEGKKQEQPIEKWVMDRRTDKQMERTGWVFIGSKVQDDVFLADRQGNIAVVYSFGETVLDTPDPESTSDMLFRVEPPEQGPAEEGDKVQVRVTPVKKNRF